MNEEIIIPVLPLREMHIYPKIVMPVIVANTQTFDSIDTAVQNFNSKILCLMEKPNAKSDIGDGLNLYQIGFLCKITQIIKMPDRKLRVLLKGEDKFIVNRLINNGRFVVAHGTKTDEVFENSLENQILREKLIAESNNYIKLMRNIKTEQLNHLLDLTDPFDVIYFVCMNMDFSIEDKQTIIELDSFEKKTKKILRLIGQKSDFIKLQKSIDSQVYAKITKMQKDHFLSEQLKTIHKELGLSADGQSEIVTFRDKIKSLKLKDEALKKAEEELSKLARISPHSPEYFVSYNYLSWIIDLPWGQPKQAKINIEKAEAILNSDHFGLEKIKERILEYLAVMQFNEASKAQILCFVGPPGVGKTSLGKSIAAALSREFVRLSVGGVTDEAEIRGHRKTYIGAMPGIIMQSLKKTGTINTLIMIDEIDKIGNDFKGDPSSALLEVLDPEQNSTFRDHFLDFGYDLSKVFFITTANNLATIPPPLRDRMEIIKLNSYTEHEKSFICRDFIIPKKIKEFATKKKLTINISDETIKSLIRNYTAEAGVRELERLVNAIFRKSIKRHLKNEIKKAITIDDQTLTEFFGMPIYSEKDLVRQDAVGVAYGLAWTAVGGEILPVEVTKYAGNGRFQMTGNIGKVMNESAKAAMSLIKKNSQKWGLSDEEFKKFDIHIHIPEGAVPKDGPSAGLVLTIAMISALSDRPVNHTFAMTGEISLTGKVLPIGGLTEKVIAAQRYGFSTVIIPEGNKKDFLELKPDAKEGLNCLFASHIDDVVDKLI